MTKELQAGHELPARVWKGRCKLHGVVPTEHRCRDYDGAHDIEYRPIAPILAALKACESRYHGSRSQIVVPTAEWDALVASIRGE